MGGGNYDDDVPISRSRSRSDDSDSSSNRTISRQQARREDILDREENIQRKRNVTREREIHDSLSILKGRKVRECFDSPDHPETTPIVIGFDGTASRGDDVVVAFRKLGMLIGQIIKYNYVPHPSLSIAAVGDTYIDKAAVQMGQFEQVQVCTAYAYHGQPSVDFGDYFFFEPYVDGRVKITGIKPDHPKDEKSRQLLTGMLDNCSPDYITLEGWQKSSSVSAAINCYIYI